MGENDKKWIQDGTKFKYPLWIVKERGQMEEGSLFLINYIQYVHGPFV